MSKHQVITGKVTLHKLQEKKLAKEKISMLTAYDYTMAKLIDTAGIDMILVGDSAANVMAGHKTTLPITVEQMIYHASSVVRAVSHAYVVVDMPFGSYQVSAEEAVKSAIRLIKETGADAVKLEGGDRYTQEAIARIITAGIPVVAHLGLRPQSINSLGGYGLQGKNDEDAQQLLKEAKELEALGCSFLVLEKIPSSLGREVSEALSIPTIGIGAGADTDGQVLVLQDMLGLDNGFSPKFLRRFADLSTVIQDAVGSYIEAVQTKDFPSEKESY